MPMKLQERPTYYYSSRSMSDHHLFRSSIIILMIRFQPVLYGSGPEFYRKLVKAYWQYEGLSLFSKSMQYRCYCDPRPWRTDSMYHFICRPCGFWALYNNFLRLEMYDHLYGTAIPSLLCCRNLMVAANSKILVRLYGHYLEKLVTVSSTICLVLASKAYRILCKTGIPFYARKEKSVPEKAQVLSRKWKICFGGHQNFHCP